MTHKPTQPGLYLVDNGACYCLDHLGCEARYTGRDISGQPIEHLTTESTFTYEGVTFGCETCKARSERGLRGK